MSDDDDDDIIVNAGGAELSSDVAEVFMKDIAEAEANSNEYPSQIFHLN